MSRYTTSFDNQKREASVLNRNAGSRIIGRTSSGGMLRTRSNSEISLGNRIHDIRKNGNNRNKNGGNNGDMVMVGVRRKNKDRDSSDRRAKRVLSRESGASNSVSDLNTQLSKVFNFSQNDIRNRSTGADVRNSSPGGFGGMPTSGASAATSTSNISTIAGLPKPDNLAEAFRIGYESKNMGNSNFFTNMLQNAVTTGFKALGQNDSDAESTFKKFSDGIARDFKGMSDFYQNSDNISNVISSFLNSVGSSSEQSKFNVAFNNTMVQQFTGVFPRAFTFEWKLYASNEAETIQIFTLIDTLKQFMHPELVDPYLNIVEFPDSFKKVDVRSPNGLVIFPIFECVLQDMSVNYTGSGNPYFFTSGAPVSISLSITLQEIRSLTRKDLQERRSDFAGGGGGGGGGAGVSGPGPGEGSLSAAESTAR